MNFSNRCAFLFLLKMIVRQFHKVKSIDILLMIDFAYWFWTSGDGWVIYKAEIPSMQASHSLLWIWWQLRYICPKREYCERYTLQLAAYCGAINRMYDTKVKHGFVVVAIPDSEAQVFQFELGDYWVEWLNRLVGYWEQQSTPLAIQALTAIHSEYDV